MKEYKYIIENFDDYQKAFNHLNDKKPELVLLKGDLGAGKTSFVGSYLSFLHGEESVKEQGFMSPTFSIVNQYDIKGDAYAHVDLYRIEKVDVEDLDLIDLLQESKMTFIEWYKINSEFTESLSKRKAYINLTKKSESNIDADTDKRILTVKFSF